MEVGPNYSPYVVTQPSDVSLGTILNNPQTYSGPAIGEFYGWAANAFNLTGAWLTDQLVGGFDPDQIGVEGACQIDHFGNYIE